MNATPKQLYYCSKINKKMYKVIQHCVGIPDAMRAAVELQLAMGDLFISLIENQEEVGDHYEDKFRFGE